MSDAETAEATEEDAPKKKSKAMLFGLVGALAMGGGAFYGVYSGMIPLPFGGEPEVAESEANEDGADHSEDADGKLQDPAFHTASFVPMEPMVISLSETARAKHLRLRLSIEVVPGSEENVTALIPRLSDVMNTFLRAVDERDFAVPKSMYRLRALMLRRVKLVTPPGSVRDVLIEEFVLN